MSYIDDLLADDDRPVREVPTPEWKCGRVFVRSISAFEMISLESASEMSDTDRLAAQLAAYLCDEKGERVCSMEQARVITHKSAETVGRVLKVGRELNGNQPAETIKEK